MEIQYLSTTHSSNFGSEETLRSFDGINKNIPVTFKESVPVAVPQSGHEKRFYFKITPLHNHPKLKCYFRMKQK